MTNLVDFSGLDLFTTVEALFQNARVQGMGRIQSIGREKLEPSDIFLSSDKDKDKLASTYIDYLYGRVMKIDLTTWPILDVYLYDRDNGQGMAKSVETQLRLMYTR